MFIFQLDDSIEHVTISTTVLDTECEAGSKQYKSAAGNQ